MPLMRYFVFVGGALLALLFVANACLPALPLAEGSRSTVDRSIIRIHSDRKWPERVVFDTSRPTITPAPAPVAAVAQAPSPQKTAMAQPLKMAQPQVREAYAQLRQNPNELRNPAPKRKRKSVAKSYVGQPRFMVAQQRPVVLFGNNIW
ncbi:hypothetical protein [Bradyrhizobium sp.]|uniref:hypothetical protein n=1 Tax=Bradyrhizobium sp. TaxID=376 RepID=UPI003C457078